MGARFIRVTPDVTGNKLFDAAVHATVSEYNAYGYAITTSDFDGGSKQGTLTLTFQHDPAHAPYTDPRGTTAINWTNSYTAGGNGPDYFRRTERQPVAKIEMTLAFDDVLVMGSNPRPEHISVNQTVHTFDESHTPRHLGCNYHAYLGWTQSEHLGLTWTYSLEAGKPPLPFDAWMNPGRGYGVRAPEVRGFFHQLTPQTIYEATAVHEQPALLNEPLDNAFVLLADQVRATREAAQKTVEKIDAVLIFLEERLKPGKTWAEGSTDFLTQNYFEQLTPEESRNEISRYYNLLLDIKAALHKRWQLTTNRIPVDADVARGEAFLNRLAHDGLTHPNQIVDRQPLPQEVDGLLFFRVGAMLFNYYSGRNELFVRNGNFINDIRPAEFAATGAGGPAAIRFAQLEAAVRGASDNHATDLHTESRRLAIQMGRLETAFCLAGQQTGEALSRADITSIFRFLEAISQNNHRAAYEIYQHMSERAIERLKTDVVFPTDFRTAFLSWCTEVRQSQQSYGNSKSFPEMANSGLNRPRLDLWMRPGELISLADQLGQKNLATALAELKKHAGSSFGGLLGILLIVGIGNYAAAKQE